ncbi:MAG: ribonuclease HII [Thermoanaerobaculum sp.]|nr:ribonuclease HII [Thermoanaerobaculum sp.]
MDEAGRGALAGPLLVAAVILPVPCTIAGLDDSKRLTPVVRQRLAAEIKEQAVAFALVRCEPWEVDRVNVYEATRQAMIRAVLALKPAPGCVVSDAVPLSGLSVPVIVEAKADAHFSCVVAASILAKVARDEVMERLHQQVPCYGWAKNKGYPTREHRQALSTHGPSPWHRQSFAPVRVVVSKKER